MTATQVHNPYWLEVKPFVWPSEFPWDSGFQVGRMHEVGVHLRRKDWTSRFCWTIPDPVTLAFVIKHAGRGGIVDPLAGTGYWAYLLREAGVDVAASDLDPADQAYNEFHARIAYTLVAQADGVDTMRSFSYGRTLLLSWPPQDKPVGADVLAAHRGDRVIYMGESQDGCTGTAEMFKTLDDDWCEFASHRPVQFVGIHDWVTVYHRK